MKNKRILLPLSILILIFTLTGCQGIDRYTRDQEAEIISRGRPILEEFFSTLPVSSVTDTEYHMSVAAQENSLIFAGQYPANAVTVEFKGDGQSYSASVDLETGEIYSDYYMFDLNSHIKKQLKPYCERYGFTGDYRVSGAEVWITIISHDVSVSDNPDKKTNSYAELSGMLPVTYNQPDEDERAAAFLKDAPISFFSIEYDMENGELFDPRILSDYLYESGNYKITNTRQRGYESYSIKGRSNATEFPASGIAAWKITLTPDENFEQMDYSVVRSDFYREDDFCFIYTAGDKYGKLDSYEEDNFSEYEFPIVIGDGIMRYRGYEAAEYITLRFPEKPKYDFSRIYYTDGEKEDPVDLIPMENEDGTWYITRKDYPDHYKYSYRFEQDQDLIFTAP